MGAPSAQVQSSQSSEPASKGAGTSASTPSGSGKGSMSATSGQPMMGNPNFAGNAGINPVTPGYDPTNSDSFGGKPNGNNDPYSNTTGSMGSVAGGPNGQPMAKGAGGGQSGGGKNNASPQ